MSNKTYVRIIKATENINVNKNVNTDCDLAKSESFVRRAKNHNYFHYFFP